MIEMSLLLRIAQSFEFAGSLWCEQLTSFHRDSQMVGVLCLIVEGQKKMIQLANPLDADRIADLFLQPSTFGQICFFLKFNWMNWNWQKKLVNQICFFIKSIECIEIDKRNNTTGKPPRCRLHCRFVSFLNEKVKGMSKRKNYITNSNLTVQIQPNLPGADCRF